MKVRLFPNSYHNIHKEPEYKARQFADIYEFIYSKLDKSPNFDASGLKSIHYGRPLKKKSLKVKRSFTTALVISYLYYGLLIFIVRSIIRRWNSKDRLLKVQILSTLLGWPRYVLRLVFRISQIFYNQ